MNQEDKNPGKSIFVYFDMTFLTNLNFTDEKSISNLEKIQLDISNWRIGKNQVQIDRRIELINTKAERLRLLKYKVSPYAPF